MAGEQESVNDIILRFTTRTGMKFAKHILQLIKDHRQNNLERYHTKGGEVDYEYLNEDGYTLNQIDISHLEDFDQFEKFAKKNGIQFAITEDPLNPDIENLWFKTTNQAAIQTFIQEILDYADEIEMDIDEDKIFDPEDLIKKKREANEFTEEIKYKLHVQDFENHEFKVEQFKKYSDLKEHLVENYDYLLVDMDLEIDSFGDVYSVKELEKVLSKIDSSNIDLQLKRDPLSKEQSRENITENTKYKLHIQDHQNKEYNLERFENFSNLKEHLVKNHDYLIEDGRLGIHSFVDIQSLKELENTLGKLDSLDITMKIERKPLVKEFKEKSKEFAKNMKDKTKNQFKNKVPEFEGR